MNKSALIRYKVLDKCFRNPGKRYFIEDLIEECDAALSERDPEHNGISLRQIRDDIAFMRSEAGWSIELGGNRDGKKMFYRYIDLNYSINDMPLNETEVNQLRSAIDILKQFDGMPQFEFLKAMLPKLNNGIDSDAQTASIIHFDNNAYLKGIGHLGPLYNAVRFKTVLKIDYQPFSEKKPNTLHFHPYHIRQFNNRWFVIGRNPQVKENYTNLALDRILSINETKLPFKEAKEIDWFEYFDDVYGVSIPPDGRVEDICLHFFGDTVPYIITKPLHGSQKSKMLRPGLLEVRLRLIPNREFISLLLSFGERVRVMHPKSLADTLKTRLQDALANYTKTNKKH